MLESSFACISRYGILSTPAQGPQTVTITVMTAALTYRLTFGTELHLYSLNLQNRSVGQSHGSHFTDVETEALGVIFTCAL